MEYFRRTRRAQTCGLPNPQPTDSKSVGKSVHAVHWGYSVHGVKEIGRNMSTISIVSIVSRLLATDWQQQSRLGGDSAQKPLFIWIGKGASLAVSQCTSRCLFDTDHNPAIDLNNRSQPLFWFGSITVLENFYLQFHHTPMIGRGHKCLCLDEE